MAQSLARRVLLRFDDICPTMGLGIWNDVERILVEFDVKPILAVVPDNQDEELIVDPPDANFWERVRAWQAQGWTIGLHGYQHRYVTKSAGVFGRIPRSEFAGLPRDEQEAKLRSAVEIFRANHVLPELWVAPAHTFDDNTIAALYDLGIRTISDGYALYPYRDSTGMMWIPQQVGRFRKVPWGVWTVCHHTNDWTSRDVAQFERDLSNFRSYFTSVPEVLEHYGQRRRNWVDLGTNSLLRLGRRAGRVIRENIRKESLPPLPEKVCGALQLPGKSSS